ncbi:hypothetical protein RCL1_003236 [Eukaryota sp. TZLM3-RCL]
MNCPICFENFSPSSRSPLIICANYHCICSSCTPSLINCPLCREPLLSQPKTNTSLLSVLQDILNGKFIPEVPADELQIDYSAILGEGGFAKVYPAIWNGSYVAVKIVALTDSARLKLQRELSIMFSLSHPLVLRVFGMTYADGRVGIVMERADHPLYSPTPLTLATITNAIDTVLAVHFLHSRSIVHHDLKPENVLMVNGKIKVADFGTARTISSNTCSKSTRAFPPKYAAPELLDDEYFPQSDVYSLGLLLYETLRFLV